MIFDTHAHYDDDQYTEDQASFLEGLSANGVGRVVNVGASMESTEASVAMSEKFDFVFAAVGVHPEGVAELTEESIARLKTLSELEKVVAIGEIGLDYYYEDPERSIQKKWFERQLELAREVALPVIIHSRDAAADTLELMKKHHAEELGGVIHCFSYSWEMAKIYLDMGFYLGIGGVVTFKNSKKLKDVVERMPLSRIVLETDAPYLTPVPNRGKRNSSTYLSYVAEEIARIKGISVAEVMEATTENAYHMYRLSQG